MVASRRQHAQGSAAAKSRAKKRKVKKDDREPETRGPVKAILGRCWCGEDYGHSWPGKSRGEPHPR
jgi:hypothetical protein